MKRPILSLKRTTLRTLSSSQISLAAGGSGCNGSNGNGNGCADDDPTNPLARRTQGCAKFGENPGAHDNGNHYGNGQH